MKKSLLSMIIVLLFLIIPNLFATTPSNIIVFNLDEDPTLKQVPESLQTQAQNFLELPENPTGIIRKEQFQLSNTQYSKLPLPLIQFSKLQEISYYSISKGKERPLFNEIYALSTLPDLKNNPLKHINTFQTKDPIPLSSNFFSPSTYYFYQNDTSFGKSIWECHLQYEKDYWVLSYTNLTPIKKGLISLIPPQKMKMLFILNQNSLYSVISADIPPLSLFKNRIKDSLDNRITAISQHFLSELQN